MSRVATWPPPGRWRYPSICHAAALLIVPGSAQAQSLTPNVTCNNPTTKPKRPGYTQVVEANTPGRILFIAGQLGYDAAGKQGPDFRTQTALVFENLKAAVEVLAVTWRISSSSIPLAAPLASTTLEIQKLAREGALIEIEAIAVLPPK